MAIQDGDSYVFEPKELRSKNMTSKEIAIVWGSIVMIVLIITGSITFYNVYAPTRPTPDALVVCASYESARSSHFCVELARAQVRQEQPR
jgi:hypothetical protein